MPSPFPGMDPYLESHWRDVHTSLVAYSRRELRAGLPDDLYARVEERVVVERWDETLYRPEPDVRVVEYPGRRRSVGGVAVVDAAAPILIELPAEELTETYIEIRDASSGNRIVTVLEFLSLSNKQPGPGRNEYLTKLNALRGGGVSLVEIDLLRGGRRGVAIPELTTPELAHATYRVVVQRAGQARVAEVNSISLRNRLPVIRIPLRDSDADAPLDLQAVFEQAYEDGSYRLTTDYSQPPVPPLTREDAQWAADLLVTQPSTTAH